MNQVADQSKNNITGVNNAASSSNLLQAADNQNLASTKIVTNTNSNGFKYLKYRTRDFFLKLRFILGLDIQIKGIPLVLL